MVSNYYAPENFSITPLCEAMVALGHDVTVITGYPQYGFPKRKPNDALVYEETLNGVHLVRLKTHSPVGGFLHRLWHYASFLSASKRYLKHHPGSYDLALAMSLSPLMSISSVLSFAKKYAIPVGLYCVDLWPESLVATGLLKKHSLLYRIINRWSRTLYTRFDRIWVGSPSYRAYLKDHHHLNNVASKTLYQPVLPISTDVISSHDRYFQLVYTGHVGRGHTIIPILQCIADHALPIQLHIVGHGEGIATLKHLQQQKGWSHLRIHSSVPSQKLGPLIAQADAMFVTLDLPTVVGETIPHKLLQAFQLQKPVLAYVRGDGAYHLQQSKGGWLMSPGASQEAIKNQLVKMLETSEELRKTMGQYNKDYFEKELNGLIYLPEVLEELTSFKKSVKGEA